MRVFTSFRNRLLLLILVFSLFTFLFAGVNTSSYLRQRENVLSDMQTIDSAYILLVQDSKAITDFLFNAHSNTDYHTTGQSPFLAMHKGYLTRIERLVGRIGMKTGNHRLGADSLHTRFRIQLHELDSKVDTAARLILRRGYKDWGMEGLMRGYAHRLENLPGIDLSHVLTLRRHEKDYIIRNEPQYVKKFNSYGGTLTEVYRNRNNLSRAMRDSVVGLLELYLQCFNTMVELNHRIGLREPQGVVHEIDAASLQLFESFDGLKRQVQLNVDVALRSLQKRFVVINILILSLASYLGYYMASQFTRPLIDLSLYISRFVRNGFKPSGRFPQANSPDEVGLLISNFRVLRNEIVELIKEFTAKVEQRTHEIYNQKQAIQAQMEEIESQRDELASKTKLIEEQRDMVVSQNQSIIDSLMFAKRIQDSMLPDPETLRSRFPESFILNLPKDIVSGDFYWCGRLTIASSG
jgi:methyl-accepting chemotaxis protein